MFRHILPFMEVLRNLSKSRYTGAVLFSNSDFECLLELSEQRISKTSFTEKSIISEMANILKVRNLIPSNLSDLIRKKIPNIKILKEFLIRESFLNLDTFKLYLNETIKSILNNLFLSKEVKHKLANNNEELGFQGVIVYRSQSIVHFMLDMLAQLKTEVVQIPSEEENIKVKIKEMSENISIDLKQKRTFSFKEEYKEVIIYIVLAIVFLISYKLAYYLFYI